MSFAIRIDGYADGSASDVDGEYVIAFVAERSATGMVLTTPQIESARTFHDTVEALAYYRQVPAPPHDLRPDGEPNRPLTAFHVTFEPVP